MIATTIEAYLMIGLLLTVAIYGTQNKWPSPIELIAGLFFWPVAVYIGIRSATHRTRPDAQKDESP